MSKTTAEKHREQIDTKLKSAKEEVKRLKEALAEYTAMVDQAGQNQLVRPEVASWQPHTSKEPARKLR